MAPLRRSESALYIEGLAELRSALKRVDSDVGPFLRKELADVARDVRDTARSYVQHKTGRHGGPNVPRLAASIQVSVTGNQVAVFTNAPQGIVQDSGGYVGRKTASRPYGVTLLKRSEVSHYMTDAARDAQAYIERRIGILLDELGRDFAH